MDTVNEDKGRTGKCLSFPVYREVGHRKGVLAMAFGISSQPFLLQQLLLISFNKMKKNYRLVVIAELIQEVSGVIDKQNLFFACPQVQDVRAYSLWLEETRNRSGSELCLSRFCNLLSLLSRLGNNISDLFVQLKFLTLYTA